MVLIRCTRLRHQKTHRGARTIFYLGIDQHRKQLTVNLRNEAGDVILRRQVSTGWSKVRSFFLQLSRLTEAEGGCVAIVEVCGFNHWLLVLLKEYGCRRVLLVQAEKRASHKTDRRDANRLYELLWTNERSSHHVGPA